MKTEADYSEWQKKTLKELRESGPIYTGQGFITLCVDNLLHEWEVIEHVSPTYHKLVCKKCGKSECIDSSG